MSKAKAKVTNVQKSKIVQTGERFLDVEITITEGTGKKKVTEIVKRGYPIGTKTKEIKDDVKKMLETRRAEIEQKAVQEPQEAEEAAADKAVEEVQGLEVAEK